jgi:hypothetical protein
VKSGALKERFGKGMISYPDIVVICGEPEYHDMHSDIVLNPAHQSASSERQTMEK